MGTRRHGRVCPRGRLMVGVVGLLVACADTTEPAGAPSATHAAAPADEADNNMHIPPETGEPSSEPAVDTDARMSTPPSEPAVDTGARMSTPVEIPREIPVEAGVGTLPAPPPVEAPPRIPDHCWRDPLLPSDLGAPAPECVDGPEGRLDSILEVTTMSELEALRGYWFVRQVRISGPEITSLEPLSCLRDSRSISVSETPLTDLTGLDSLERTIDLTVRDNPQLKSLRGAPKWKQTAHLNVFGNPLLESLDGTPPNTVTLSVSESPALRDLRGLERVKTVLESGRVHTELLLSANVMLNSLNGLRCPARLTPVNNPALSNCALLEHTAAVGSSCTTYESGTGTIWHCDPDSCVCEGNPVHDTCP